MCALVAARKIGRPHPLRHPLSGLVTCAACGCPLLGWPWELGLHRGTRAGRGLDTQPSAEGLHPVPESEKAGAAVESGAVTHPDPKDVVVDDYVDVDDRGVGVLAVLVSASETT
jgi:hypothetical protein